MSQKTALITGVRGQDGAYLSQLLLEKGYHVIGTDRRRVDQNDWRLKYLGIENDVQIEYMDLLDTGNVYRTIQKFKPDEVYNLAAQSFVKVSFDQPELTANVDAMGVLRLLEAIKIFSPDTKFYQASTSEMFGKIREKKQSELTPLYPRSPYGVAKVFAHYLTINYRESFDLFACSGILFNHESPLRGLEFVTRKITHAIASIKLGHQDLLVLGNMDAQRDWGYAKDYVEGMWRMLQHDVADDYVLATGETQSVRTFVNHVFAIAGMPVEWEGVGIHEIARRKDNGKVVVSISEDYYRPAEVDVLLGDPTKAYETLGWKAKTDCRALAEVMYKSDFNIINAG